MKAIISSLQRLVLNAGLALSLAAGAHAAPVVGTGQGSFSNLSSCDYTGGDRDCRIVNTAANGANTQVQWGSQNKTTDFVNPSTLTAVDLVINANTNAYGVKLGELDWYNSATLRLNDSLDSLAVKWTMALNFTTPSGPDPSGGEPFALTIKNPVNPTGDSIYGFELADLSNLKNSFSLSGITVSNLRYLVADGSGAGTSFLNTSSKPGKTYWYNDEYNNSSLYVVADFTAPPVTTPIPEPEIYAMMGFGLGLLGWVGRRKKLKEAAAA
jgi:hypothetical protein